MKLKIFREYVPFDPIIETGDSKIMEQLNSFISDPLIQVIDTKITTTNVDANRILESHYIYYNEIDPKRLEMCVSTVIPPEKITNTVKWPRFVVMGNDTAIRLTSITSDNTVAYYYRDGGDWSVQANYCKDSNGNIVLMTTYENWKGACGIELKPCTREYWRKSNGPYAPTDEAIQSNKLKDLTAELISD